MSTFQSLSADNDITEVESLCMSCHETGKTRLLLTRIPHFREVVLVSFSCPHCHYENNEIQSAASIQEYGRKFVLEVNGVKELSRQVVKSETCSLKMVELDIEVPPSKGILTTIEGVIQNTIDDLSMDQEQRKQVDVTVHDKIESILAELQAYLEGKCFTLVLDDPAGNSFIENPHAPSKDPSLEAHIYKRTRDQEIALGMKTEDDTSETDDREQLKGEVHEFPGNCSRCSVPSVTRMHLLDIPHFKEVVIMATTCDSCGYKSSEVKAGGAIAARGKRITLRLVDIEDLNRDILKSETATLGVPEIDLELFRGTLGGRFTTIEGILQQVIEELESNVPFMGDSAQEEGKRRFDAFIKKLQRLLELKEPFTLVLDDPLANSYIQNLYAPDPDPNMDIEEYERTFEQNEDFGLNDMHV